MQKKLLGFSFIILLNFSNASAATLLDQSFIRESKGNLYMLLNECCKYVAQTFTAGITGKLDSVRVDIKASPSSESKLRISIWSTDNGIPKNQMTSTTLNSDSSLPTNKILFPTNINLQSGMIYALVADYTNAPSPGVDQHRGYWTGEVGNQYLGGNMLAYYDDIGAWVIDNGTYDAYFETNVNPIPAPPAIWLLCSGILGLLGINWKKARKKAATMTPYILMSMYIAALETACR